jgi:thioredoxin reductase (NADPH)
VSRRHQIFPELTDAEIARIRRFGVTRHYAKGERLITAGEPGPGMFVVLKGRVTLSQRDGFGSRCAACHPWPRAVYRRVATLSGGSALWMRTRMKTSRRCLCRPSSCARLIVAEADLGERIVRALILRRVGLIELGASGAVLIAAAQSAGVLRLQNFPLQETDNRTHAVDATHDEAAAAWLAQYGASSGDVLAICPNGSCSSIPPKTHWPAALACSTLPSIASSSTSPWSAPGPRDWRPRSYAASEGLHVVVLDCRAFGGQAGASSRIENYLGFPTGISGMALAGRAMVQAQKFGAEIMIPAQAAALECARSGARWRIGPFVARWAHASGPHGWSSPAARSIAGRTYRA